VRSASGGRAPLSHDFAVPLITRPGLLLRRPAVAPIMGGGGSARRDVIGRARPQPWTVDDFLAFEAEESERYEFVDGIVRMMTGGSAAHSKIKGNLSSALDAALGDGPCSAYVDDLKVVTANAVMYSDVLVICRALAPDDDRVSDPTVIIEVLSPTTETHDRIRKWREYQTIATLLHFVLVTQNERRVELYSRTEAGWEITVVEPPEDAVVLKATGVRLSLEAIYHRSGR
jgi:Uma2 family endonuclease